MISFASGYFFHHWNASSISARVGRVGSDLFFTAYEGMTKHPGCVGGLSAIVQNRWIIFSISLTIRASPAGDGISYRLSIFRGPSSGARVRFHPRLYPSGRADTLIARTLRFLMARVDHLYLRRVRAQD